MIVILIYLHLKMISLSTLIVWMCGCVDMCNALDICIYTNYEDKSVDMEDYLSTNEFSSG